MVDVAALVAVLFLGAGLLVLIRMMARALDTAIMCVPQDDVSIDDDDSAKLMPGVPVEVREAVEKVVGENPDAMYVGLLTGVRMSHDKDACVMHLASAAGAQVSLQFDRNSLPFVRSMVGKTYVMLTSPAGRHWFIPLEQA